jgi:Holliday junction resolvase RusA-like endonuclease
MGMTTTFVLSCPPSLNGLFRNIPKRGRVKTKKYKAWIKQAGWELVMQRPSAVSGPYDLAIVVPKTRGDLDNYGKAISDLLVTHKLIDDDVHARKIILSRDDRADAVTVTISKAA